MFHKSLTLSLLLAATLFALSLPACADEFAAAPLNSGWKISQSHAQSPAAVAISRGRLSMVSGAEDPQGVKLLRGEIPGDWQIETDVIPLQTDPLPHTFRGLLLWKDPSHFLTWGIDGNSRLLATFGSSDGGQPVSRIVGSTDSRHEFLKLRKFTTGYAHTRYVVYWSNDRTTWTSVGYWDDTAGVFDGSQTQYGLMASSESSRLETEFDYFTEIVPVNETTYFREAKLDLLWETNPAASASSQITAGGDGLIMAVSPSPGAADSLQRSPRILKTAKWSDWIIDTRMKQAPPSECGFAGLLVANVSGDALQLGYNAAKGATEMRIVHEMRTMPGEANGKVIAGAAGWHRRLRMEKLGREYRGFYSDDGIDWTPLGTWQDRQDRLDGARYGLSVANSEKTSYSVNFEFFRQQIRPNGAVKSISHQDEIGKLAGEKAMNDTLSSYDVGGGDLGSMVEMGDKVFVMFGDSFVDPDTKWHNWRSNTLAVSSTTDPSHGIFFDKMIAGADGKAKTLIDSAHADFNDMTSIPTNGVAVGGTLYYSFMNVYHWGAGGHWDCNFSEFASSGDGGNTWVKHDSPRWGPNSNFMQLAIVHDARTTNLIDLFGYTSGGYGGVKLMRVPEGSLLKAADYRYFAGTDLHGKPKWSENEADAATIVPASVREVSVMFDKYLGRYIMAYRNEDNWDIELRDAPSPWGPWSNPVLLADHTRFSDNVFESIYGSFLTPKYTGDNGRIIYFNMSKWNGYNVWLERATLNK